jgi:hypothetical protein
LTRPGDLRADLLIQAACYDRDLHLRTMLNTTSSNQHLAVLRLGAKSRESLNPFDAL